MYIYLSLRVQVVVGTFFRKSPVYKCLLLGIVLSLSLKMNKCPIVLVLWRAEKLFLKLTFDKKI